MRMLRQDSEDGVEYEGLMRMVEAREEKVRRRKEWKVEKGAIGFGNNPGFEFGSLNFSVLVKDYKADAKPRGEATGCRL